MDNSLSTDLSKRFRGYLPIVIDVETGGFNAKTDALLEIAAVIPAMDEHGNLYSDELLHFHVEPFPNANIEPESLKVNGIKPHHPFRMAIPEKEALLETLGPIRKAVKNRGCNRAILVGHNATFDLGFLNAAIKRSGIKRNPFHPFSTFDTACLSGLAYGQTVLAKAIKAAGIHWDESKAHSAKYDTEKTAELFFIIVNRWRTLALNAAPEQEIEQQPENRNEIAEPKESKPTDE